MLVLFEQLVIDDGQLDGLLGLARVEGEGALGANVIGTSLGGAILGAIVDGARFAQVATGSGHSHLEATNVLHHGIVARLEEDSHRVHVLDLDALGFLLLKLGLHLAQVALRPFADLLAQIPRTDHLPRRLHPVERSALRPFAEHLLVRHHFQLFQRQGRILLPQLSQSVDVVPPRLLEFLRLGRVGVHHVVKTVLLRLDFELHPAVRVACLGLHDHTPLVHPVTLVQILVDEEAAVGHVGREHGCREEGEGEYALPNFEHARARDRQDQVEPNVSEDAPRGGDEENSQMFDLPRLPVRYHEHAQRDDDEEIVSGRADDRARPQFTGLEVLRPDLDDRQKDLWRATSQRHQRQVRHRLVPYSHHNDLRLLTLPANDQFLLLRGDHLDRRHETIADDRHADEQVQQQGEVYEAAEDYVRKIEILLRPPYRYNQTWLATSRVISRHLSFPDFYARVTFASLAIQRGKIELSAVITTPAGSRQPPIISQQLRLQRRIEYLGETISSFLSSFFKPF